MRNVLLRQPPLTSLWSALLFFLVLVMMRSNACHDFISVIIPAQEDPAKHTDANTRARTHTALRLRRAAAVYAVLMWHLGRR